MYISCAIIPVSEKIDSYFIKNEIWKSFPDKEENRRRFIYNIEGEDEAKITMISKLAPINTTMLVWKTKEIQEALFNAKIYNIIVKINSSTRNAITDKRHAIKEQDQISEMFNKLAKTNGFNIRGLEIIRTGNIYFKEKKGKSATHYIAEIIANIEVFDMELFKKAFLEGIGKSRGYGLGMIRIQSKDIE